MKKSFVYLISVLLFINTAHSQLDTNVFNFLSYNGEWLCNIFHGDFSKNEQNIVFNDSITLDIKYLGKKIKKKNGNLYRKIEISCNCIGCIDSNCLKPFSVWSGILSYTGIELNMYFDSKYYSFLSEKDRTLLSEFWNSLDCLYLYYLNGNYVLQSKNEIGYYLKPKKRPN